MSTKTLRVLFVSAIMIMTSLAGCIESSEDSTDDSGQSDEYYGTIMTQLTTFSNLSRQWLAIPLLLK